MTELEYLPDSLLPKTDRESIEAYVGWLQRYYEKTIRLPDSYVDHVLNFHGGVPGKACFKARSKGERVLCRFFNFLQDKDITPPCMPSWRTEHGRSASKDIRLDYSVWRYLDEEPWNQKLTEFEERLVPIACLDTAGHNAREMAEYDLLCFSYSGSAEPAVVSFDYHQSQLALVAKSFDRFLSMLRRCSNAALKKLAAEHF
jgi:hypothetical protein